MTRAFIKINSMTLAVRCRDILISNGLSASLSKNPSPQRNSGCGYAIFTDNITLAFEVLRRAGIRDIALAGVGAAL